MQERTSRGMAGYEKYFVRPALQLYPMKYSVQNILCFSSLNALLSIINNRLYFMICHTWIVFNKFHILNTYKNVVNSSLYDTCFTCR